MSSPSQPLLRDVGLSGLLVTFSDTLTDGANSAALAFRAAVDSADVEGILETTTSLTSVLISFDISQLSRDDLRKCVLKMLGEQDWEAAPLPTPHKLWHIPACFAGEYAPQLGEAAELAGISEARAIQEIEATTLRVMTLGFAPGQPYLGSLPDNWNIPRQTGLTKSVPRGAVTVAIRQITTFTNSAPTGWRQIGQMAFANFNIDGTTPIALTPGDEVRFHAISERTFAKLLQNPSSPYPDLPGTPSGNGGASFEVVGG
ncbi:carboxyltransferase domain-containing protein [Halocynthiibacter sp. C4]|uniref:5-oxoprolinase subunit B family protein n=1 Tax=Halocynthiibacter sp. C4 TaxID=2992758 RepID=UPI00237C0057|nr:carboxyltransferase domain-containing protein [Halocynthiibacter sp. C4]MDE0588850.1 carboxyltransferase domain-containing protein [Halocynthiibacter sp. C4]